MALTKQDKAILRKLHTSQGLTEKAWEEKIMFEFVKDLIAGTKSVYKDAVLEVAGKKELSEQLAKLQIVETDDSVNEKTTSKSKENDKSSSFNKVSTSV
ncbi:MULTISPECIES: hypothetical protein [Lactobacillus]|uniref:Uncharacterized protein n=1 Tax=Lactobacillus xujianguonis TaxID=2495899 RepID=A0A437SWM0_9LACO|nr:MULTISPECIES: hypothetical protein [Lactobacillus]RVU71217.1 hypothetical protein EJK17_03200 [Lactobacillus xujianguonis]